MRTIYNKNLVPDDPLYRDLSDKFYPFVRGLLQAAYDGGLNPRDVSHQFAGILSCIEAEICLGHALRKGPK